MHLLPHTGISSGPFPGQASRAHAPTRRATQITLQTWRRIRPRTPPKPRLRLLIAPKRIPYNRLCTTGVPLAAYQFRSQSFQYAAARYSHSPAQRARDAKNPAIFKKTARKWWDFSLQTLARRTRPRSPAPRRIGRIGPEAKEAAMVDIEIQREAEGMARHIVLTDRSGSATTRLV